MSDPCAERRRELAQRFGLDDLEDNAQCAGRGEVVVLAVKPQFLQPAVDSISAVLQRQKPLVVSIAAGIRCADILRWGGGPLALVRAMPNTPALVNAGISGLFANELVTEKQRNLAQTILRAVGETVWVKQESLIDAVTGVSGSGPAYFFKLMELMAASAVRHGLDPETANALAVQTARGRGNAGQTQRRTQRRATGDAAPPSHLPRRHHRSGAGENGSRRTGQRHTTGHRRGGNPRPTTRRRTRRGKGA